MSESSLVYRALQIIPSQYRGLGIDGIGEMSWIVDSDALP
jgi:hypothetical protein